MRVASVTATEPRAAVEEDVVLLDAQGRAIGSMPKRSVHGPDTPLHLGFSCHVVGHDGRLLLTRRAETKTTWPATWTNGCCGHPLPGESLRDAVTRRLRDELGLVPGRMALALPDFIYRAVMDNGIVEHELCPVVVAEVEGAPRPNPDEVDDAVWVSWDALRHRARTEPASLSPWVVAQISRLDELGAAPRRGSTHRRCRSTSMCRPSTAPPFPGRAAALSRPFPQSTRSPPCARRSTPRSDSSWTRVPPTCARSIPPWRR